MSDHTPGPWSVRDNNYIIGPDGFGLASAYSGNGVQDNVLPGEANASLIAAAPEMLAVLKALFSDPDNEPLWFAADAWAQKLVDDARAAIAKAEGPLT